MRNSFVQSAAQIRAELLRYADREGIPVHLIGSFIEAKNVIVDRHKDFIRGIISREEGKLSFP